MILCVCHGRRLFQIVTPFNKYGFREIQKEQLNNLKKLKQKIQPVWNSTAPDIVEKFVNSMENRLQKCMKKQERAIGCDVTFYSIVSLNIFEQYSLLIYYLRITCHC